MSLAHRRAVIAGLVTGGFLLSGLSVSTPDPAFANAATAARVPGLIALALAFLLAMTRLSLRRRIRRRGPGA
jgi:hypothetical protein